MFLHGSWMHLLGNMWFLWLFGNNIEDAMTRPRFVVFYLACGLAAALAQVWTNPTSVVPMVGASGAISGVMGAYLILFPRVRVWTMVFLGIFFVRTAVPAWGMLLYWAFLQLASGLTTVGGEGGGVAFWAHIGGFVAGAILVRPLVRPDHLAEHQRVTGSRSARADARPAPSASSRGSVGSVAAEAFAARGQLREQLVQQRLIVAA
jgi:membrane associated rhomboid family serine protease